MKDASYAWEGTPVIRDLTTTIMRGDKVGIIGPNGCGKTTLLKLLLGQLAPQSGTVEHGHEPGDRLLRPAPRGSWMKTRRSCENACGDNEYVIING